MKLDADISRRVKRHLIEVGDHLHHLPQSERREVLRLVYSHILNALQNQPGNRRDIQALEAIIAEMDSPEHYAGKSIASLAKQEIQISPEENKHAEPSPKGPNWTLISLAAIGALLLLAWGVLKNIADRKPDPVRSLEFRIATSFMDDPDIPGRWIFTDNTNLPAYFEIDGKGMGKERPPFTEIMFRPHGKTKDPRIGWTRGLVLRTKNKTASRYILKTIRGTDYMLLEWLDKNQMPHRYGFRKTGPTDNAIIAEGIGWGDYAIGASREKLAEALAPLAAGGECGGLRGKRINCIEAMFGPDGLCREIHFDIGFAGETTKGLRIGSTLEEARKAYGTPCDMGKKGSLTTLGWPAQGIRVWAKQGRIIQIIVTAPEAGKMGAH